MLPASPSHALEAAASQTLLLDREEVIRMADEAGIAIKVVDKR